MHPLIRRLPGTSLTISLLLSLRFYFGLFVFSSKQQNAILAETPAGVKFSVRLFKHEDRTVVVVRRHKGCSLDFRDAAESVLRSARGLPLKRRKQLRRFSSPP